jgi:hypothetical protein
MNYLHGEKQRDDVGVTTEEPFSARPGGQQQNAARFGSKRRLHPDLKYCSNHFCLTEWHY